MNQATEGVGSPGWPPWDDKEQLYWDTAPRIRAFRALQSWYREKELKVPPAPHPSKSECWIGNHLKDDAATDNKNFLDEDIAAYARSRADDIKQKKATPVFPRLDHNMLGSMPLCFNFLGPLRTHPEIAAGLLGHALGRDIGRILAIEVEVAPRDKADYLDDNTAFDALVLYESKGSRGLLAIETKYTEPFSRVPSDNPKNKKTKRARDKLLSNPAYRVYSGPAYGWSEGAFEKLALDHATNQLWRNVMLAMAVKEKGISDRSAPGLPTVDSFDEAHVLVVSAKADKTAIKATVRVNDAYKGPAKPVTQIFFGDMIERALEVSELSAWATEFRRRYLDLTPVLESPTFSKLRLDPDLTST